MDSASINRIFRAFADPTRLRILRLLTGGELCVGDLVTVLDVPQPTASRHLAYLRKAGLIASRKNSYWTFYRLAPARSVLHRRLLDCLDTCFRDVPELTKDARQIEQLRKRGGCCPP